MIQIIDERGEGIYTTPNLKENHRGEALLLRGYANFMLWNFFGTAPVIKERIQETDKINPPSSSGNQLLDQAISDFQEAATLLPESWSENNRGRATKSSANGYLGKALVYRATVTKNNMDYTAAIAAFNQITDKALTPEFDDNFDVKLENNSESLFEYQANNPTGGDNVWLSNDFDIPIGSISAFYGYFEDIEQLYGNAYNATQKLYNAFEPTDPRRDKTVIQSTNERTPLKIQKYWTQDVKTGQVGSYNNTRMLRYADVLLLKAEALVQSGGSLAEAIALINQIRTRARNSGPAGTIAPADYAPTEIDRNKVMDWVRNERFLELAAEEGNRWLDLRRWHLGGQLNLATWDFSSIGNEVDFDVTKHLYMPIPSRETDLNTNIVQNPGY
jgi:tetratricopeptide (TPR) repeat protein